jgi:hypothetical protein
MAGALCHLDCCELRRTTSQRLKQHLQNVDVIYVAHGNTFYLRHYMRTSGFDKLVPPLVRDGVIYVGVSSGSISVGRSICTALWKGWDNPGYGEEWDASRSGYDGLGLIPGGKSLFPHYLAWQHEQLLQQRRPTLGHDLIVLSDDQAYISDGRREYILGANGEVSSATHATPQSPKSMPQSPSFPLTSQRVPMSQALSLAAPSSPPRFPSCRTGEAPLGQLLASPQKPVWGQQDSALRQESISPKNATLGQQQSASPKSAHFRNAPSLAFGTLTPVHQTLLGAASLASQSPRSDGLFRHTMPTGALVSVR